MSESNPGVGAIERGSAPAKPEAEKGKELINPEKAGLQAALLMDGKSANKESAINELTKIQSEVDAPKLEKITKNSLLERDNYWNEKDPGGTKSFQEKKSEWVANTDKIFEAFKGIDGQKDLLAKFGVDDNNGADKFYSTYFEAQKGNLGFFGKIVAEKFSEEDLRNAQKKVLKVQEKDENGYIVERSISLLDAIGGFYGKNSAEVAKLVAEGMFNLRNNGDNFMSAASSQIENLSDEDKAIINGINNRSSEWDVREKARLDKIAEERKKQEDERKESEAIQKSPEELENEIKELCDRISSSDNNTVKDFLPILKAFKTKPEEISDDAYKNSAKAAIEAFTQAESITTNSEEDKLKSIISLFDTLSTSDTSKLTDNDKEFYKDRINTILGQLQDINIKITTPDKYTDEIKSKAIYIQVKVNDDDVGKEVVRRHCFMKGEQILRPPEILIGIKRKETVDKSPTGGEGEQAQPAQAEVKAGEEPIQVAAENDQATKDTEADEAKTEVALSPEEELKAKFEAATKYAGRELTEEEKKQIENSNDFRDVIKIDTIVHSTTPDGSENK